MPSIWKRPWQRAMLAATLGAVAMVGFSATSLRAQDEEDNSPDVKALRNLLHVLGLRRDGPQIEYRERSPLVLPSGRDLPPPEKAEAGKVAGWPDDPDLKERRRVRDAERKRQPYTEGVDDRPLLPSQYGSAAAPQRRSRPDGSPIQSAEEAALPSTPKELGSKSIFSSIWAPKEEYKTFASEPPRTSLTEPPAGYRTPSPNQPYGVGKEKWKPGKIDRHEDVR